MPARHLTLAVIAVVLFAGVLHATWNAIASAISDKTVAFALIGAAQALIAVIVLPIVGLPRSAAVAFAAGSAVIHVVYTAALLQSYRLGDFGRTYPLARGTAPLLVGVGAWLLAGERLSPLQVAGTCTIAAALTAIVFAGGRLTRADLPATVVALLTGVTIAAYTVVDGLGVRHAHNPAGYLALLWSHLGPRLRHRRLGADPRTPGPRVSPAGNQRDQRRVDRHPAVQGAVCPATAAALDRRRRWRCAHRAVT
jgi:hypothetical protein